MEEHIEKSLEEKAIEVSKYLDSMNFLNTYRLVDYSINFTLQYNGKKQTLSLSYSPNKKRWTAYSSSGWIKNAIIPSVQPMLSEKVSSIGQKETSLAEYKYGVFSGEVYFAEAFACLDILEPFAEEYIDFSVICDFTQQGVRLVLNDPRCAYLDRTPLLEMLEQPLLIGFHAAKEYLYRCLTLCGVTKN